MFLRVSAIGVSVALVLSGCGATSQPGSSSSPPVTVTVSPPPRSGPQPGGPAVLTPVIGSVIAPPIPVAATDGKTHLAYELLLTNTLRQIVTVTSLAVVAGQMDSPAPGKRTLLTLSGAGLAYWTRALGGDDRPTATIGAGQAALVWLDVVLDAGAAVPTEVTHEIGMSLRDPTPPLIEASMTEILAPTTVDTFRPVTISPPLRGPNWLDANGCCDMTPHRLAVNPISGAFWVAERFAIDFVQLTPGGQLFTGDKTRVESYPYYGADVLAVADGPVVAVVDGLRNQVPGTDPQGLPLDQYGGNHVVQDLGGGNYAFYAHLKPGSITVKVGDRLTTGTVLGALGNSGNTDAPHLHFHLMSSPDPLRSNGLPFVFDRFSLDSRVVSLDAIAALVDTGGPVSAKPVARDETSVMPSVLDVMSYPTG